MSRLEIGHQDDGDDNLVGGESQDKGNQDDAIQPHEPPEGVKEAGQIQKDALASHVDVGQYPDNQTGRRRDGDGSAQHKQSSVKDRADYDLANLGPSVRGKLQREGGWHSL